MDALESLLQAAKADQFNRKPPHIATFPKPLVERPVTPLAAVFPATLTRKPSTRTRPGPLRAL